MGKIMALIFEGYSEMPADENTVLSHLVESSSGQLYFEQELLLKGKTPFLLGRAMVTSAGKKKEMHEQGVHIKQQLSLRTIQIPSCTSFSQTEQQQRSSNTRDVTSCCSPETLPRCICAVEHPNQCTLNSFYIYPV